MGLRMTSIVESSCNGLVHVRWAQFAPTLFSLGLPFYNRLPCKTPILEIVRINLNIRLDILN